MNPCTVSKRSHIRSRESKVFLTVRRRTLAVRSPSWLYWIIMQPGDAGDVETEVVEGAGNEFDAMTRIPEPPPDGGYGWVCVAACFIINGFTWGVLAVSLIHYFVLHTFLLLQSYGVYLAYYLQSASFPDATSLDFALIGGFNFSMAMIVSPIATVLARHFGLHTPMIIGIILQTGGFIAASFATKIWQLYLSQGILVGWGVGLTWIPSIAVLPQWFHKKRSFANGICSAGSGIGGIIFSFSIRAAIANTSLAWSLRMCGLVSGAMNIVATMMIRSRNHIVQPKQHPFDPILLCRYEVFLVLVWGFLSMFGYMPVLFSLSDFARSLGLGADKAATVTALLNLGTAVGRPFVGVLSDRLGRIETAGMITLLCAISVFAIWIPATNYGVTILFAIVNGAILGVFWMVSSTPCLNIIYSP